MEKCFTYCINWGYGPVVIAKELARNKTNEPGKNATEPFVTRECASNYFISI